MDCIREHLDNRPRGLFYGLLLVFLILAGCTSTPQSKPRSRGPHSLPAVAGTISGPTSPLPPPIAEVRPGVVCIEGRNRFNEPVAFGTGFFISDREVVTCLHVIEPAEKLVLIRTDGSPLTITGIHGVDPENDLAVLSVDSGATGIRPLEMRLHPAVIGEEVTALGSPKYLNPNVAFGRVLDYSEEGIQVLDESFFISAPVFFGFSGSPVVDSNGRAMGVVAMTTRSRETNGLAVPIELVARLRSMPPTRFSAWRERNPAPDREIIVHLVAGKKLIGRNASEAIVHFDQVLVRSPKHFEANMSKGLCLSQLNRHAEALRCFRLASEARPDFLPPRLQMAVIHAEDGRIADALAEMEAAAAVRPNSAVIEVFHGYLELFNQNVAAAVKHFRAAETLAPDRRRIVEHIGHFLMSSGQYAKALERFKRLVQNYPLDSRIQRNAAYCEWMLGQSSEAESRLGSLPDSQDAIQSAAVEYFLHVLAARSADTTGSRLHFERALAAARKFPKSGRRGDTSSDLLAKVMPEQFNDMDAHVRWSAFLVSTGQSFEAHASLTRILQIRPGQPDALALLASIHASRLDFESAESMARRAITFRPDSANAHDALGLVQAGAGRMDRARDHFMRALALEPKSQSALLHLASVEERLGNRSRKEQLLRDSQKHGKGLPQWMRQNVGLSVLDPEQVRLIQAY